MSQAIQKNRLTEDGDRSNLMISSPKKRKSHSYHNESFSPMLFSIGRSFVRLFASKRRTYSKRAKNSKRNIKTFPLRVISFFVDFIPRLEASEELLHLLDK